MRLLPLVRRLMTMLDWDQPADFVTLQFTKTQYWCVLYRLVYAGYLVTVLGACTLTSGYSDKVMIFLTYWSFTTLMVCQITSFLNASIYRPTKHEGSETAPSRPDHLPWKFRIQWILYNVSSGAAFIVTAMFWLVEYKGTGISVCSFHLHAINTCFVIMDTLITTTPVYFRHALFTVLYAVVYSIFTVLYWLGGGTDHHGNPYIYSVLDYSHRPVRAVLYLCATSFVAPPISHGILWMLYKLRHSCIERRISRPPQIV